MTTNWRGDVIKLGPTVQITEGMVAWPGSSLVMADYCEEFLGDDPDRCTRCGWWKSTHRPTNGEHA